MINETAIKRNVLMLIEVSRIWRFSNIDIEIFYIGTYGYLKIFITEIQWIMKYYESYWIIIIYN